MTRELEELLDLLIENERQLARYYGLLVDFIPEHSSIWRSLCLQEEGHAEALERVRERVRQNPELYQPGKYSITTLRVMIRDVGEMISGIERRDVHPEYAVSFAAGIEGSFVESRLEDAIMTNVVEVQSVLRRLTEQTQGHRDLLRSIAP